jgi:hypothetical protein
LHPAARRSARLGPDFSRTLLGAPVSQQLEDAVTTDPDADG